VFVGLNPHYNIYRDYIMRTLKRMHKLARKLANMHTCPRDLESGIRGLAFGRRGPDPGSRPPATHLQMLSAAEKCLAREVRVVVPGIWDVGSAQYLQSNRKIVELPRKIRVKIILERNSYICLTQFGQQI
jgi:hypothetical protein